MAPVVHPKLPGFSMRVNARNLLLIFIVCGITPVKADEVPVTGKGCATADVLAKLPDFKPWPAPYRRSIRRYRADMVERIRKRGAVESVGADGVQTRFEAVSQKIGTMFSVLVEIDQTGNLLRIERMDRPEKRDRNPAITSAEKSAIAAIQATQFAPLPPLPDWCKRKSLLFSVNFRKVEMSPFRTKKSNLMENIT